VTTFTYKLPFTVFDLAARLAEAVPSPTPKQADDRAAYLLLLSSQSGKTDRQIDTQVIVPESWQMHWSTGQQMIGHTLAAGFVGAWDQDRLVAGLFETSHAQTQAINF
jgi:hypothetical protein